MKPRYKFAFIIFFYASISSAQVSISVNKGSFASVQEAGAGEEKVNFANLDPSCFTEIPNTIGNRVHKPGLTFCKLSQNKIT